MGRSQSQLTRIVDSVLLLALRALAGHTSPSLTSVSFQGGGLRHSHSLRWAAFLLLRCEHIGFPPRSDALPRATHLRPLRGKS